MLQILILCKPTEDLTPKYTKQLAFAHQLKAGKGLTVVVSVLEGDYTRRAGESLAAKQAFQRAMEQEKVKGFVEVLVARSTSEGLAHLIQTTGQFFVLYFINTYFNLLTTLFSFSVN